MKKTSSSRVVLQPNSGRAFVDGGRQVVDAVRPTLGPLPRHVVVQRPHRNETPEVLDDAGLIARRIAQIADRDEDMGAMHVRQMLWRQREEEGDGAATTAVIYQALMDAGLRHLAAGGNAMRLRGFLEAALDDVLLELADQIEPLDGLTRIQQLAASICPDPVLPPLLAEIYATIGRYGHLDVRVALGPETEREYILGAFWEGGLLSQRLVTDPKRLRGEIDDAALLMTDFEIQDPRALVPALEAARSTGRGGLVIVARSLAPQVNAFLQNVSSQTAHFKAMAVKVPGATALDQAAALEDLAALTGGQAFVQVTGVTLERVRPTQLGRARQAWADAQYLGILDGGGDRDALERHVDALLSSLHSAEGEAEDKARERIGRLTGKVARLLIGGATAPETTLRRELAERAARVIRRALASGVVPGGGAALLACRPALQRALQDATDADARAAYRCLAEALAAPTRTLLANVSLPVEPTLARLKPGQALDLRTGLRVTTQRAGLWDSAAVLHGAIRRAVSGAALALTVDVLVHHAKPETTFEP